MATKNKILCSDCGMPIENNSDLIVAHKPFLPIIHPYHCACYSRKLKTRRAAGYPVNGYQGSMEAVFGMLALVGGLVYAVAAARGVKLAVALLLAALGFISLFTRWYSWWRYERRLP
jgi:ABC-type xylose transport system permease subunit